MFIQIIIQWRNCLRKKRQVIELSLEAEAVASRLVKRLSLKRYMHV